MNSFYIMEQLKYNSIQKFVKEAKEFFNTRDVSPKSLVDHLENIATIDFSSISNNKVEITNFFNILWSLMFDHNVFYQSGTLVLINAVKDSTCRHLLVHTFRFMPILTEFLLNGKMSSEERVKILNLMEDLTGGLKINWQEPYLLKLIEKLYAWIMDNEKDVEVCKASLSVLVNICDGNPFVVNLLMEYIDMRELMKHLINSSTNSSNNVEVCRLLLNLRNSQDLPTMDDVHRFLEVAMQSFSHSIRNMNKRSLRHVDMLLNDMCSNSITKSHVSSYENFEIHLEEAIKHVPMLFAISNDDCKCCLQIIFSILTTLINLELYSLRNAHKIIIELCIKANVLHDLIGRSYNLLANIILQYEEDGMLPDDVASVISTGLHGLLDPLKLDIKTSGIEWLRFICALNDCHAMRDSILHNINVEKFEDLVKQIIQNNTVYKNNNEQEPVIIACYICLSFIKRSTSWDMCLHHILSESKVQKILSNSINNVPYQLKKRFLEIIKNPDFPSNRINEVFFHKEEISDQSLSNDSFNSIEKNIQNAFCGNNVISNAQKLKMDSIISKIENESFNNKLENVSSLDVIELYRYKISNMEHNLNITQESLKAASHTVTQLNHSIALLQGTNKRQEEILLKTHFDNEKLKENVTRLSEQMGDAEKTIKKFQVKLTGEKLYREQQAADIHREYSEKLSHMEMKINSANEELERKNVELNKLTSDNINLEKRLLRENEKNNELGDVLHKFEKKIKQNDDKLKEAQQKEAVLRNELTQSAETIKTLEKTLLEREQRLNQVTTRLEDMQRVQEMIASLMNKGSANVSSNSTN